MEKINSRKLWLSIGGMVLLALAMVLDAIYGFDVKPYAGFLTVLLGAYNIGQGIADSNK